MDDVVRCSECGAHFVTAPGQITDGMPCSECGGQRLYREQPNPTQSDGALRDMVDPDTQQDMGGNPLGEGTIMGSDGEQPFGKRDNFMHSNTSATEPVMDRTSFNTDIYPALWHEAADIGPLSPTAPAQQQGTMYQQQHPNQFPGANMTPAEFGLGAATALLPGVGEAAAGALGLGGAEAAGEGALAEGGAEAEGGGLLNKGVGLAQKAISPLMKGVMGVGAGGGAAAPTGMSQPATQIQLGGSTIPMVLLADFETALSTPSVDEQSDDPMGQDQQQFRDGDMSPSNFHNPNLEDSGSMGEDNARSDSAYQQGFAENSPAIERYHMVEPLAMHYYNSSESGERDPIIRGLHEALEQENPGYLNNPHPEAEMALQQLLHQHRNPSPMGVHAAQGYDLGEARFPTPHGVNDLRMNVSPWGEGEVYDANLSPRDPRHSVPMGGDDPLGTVMMQGVPGVPNSASGSGRSGIPGVYDRLEENGFDWGNHFPMHQGGVNMQQQLPGGAPTTGTLPGQPPVNAPAMGQQGNGSCPNCGGTMGANGACPQCGAGGMQQGLAQMPQGGSNDLQQQMQQMMPPAMAGIAQRLTNNQGPVTPEQIAAVQQLLVDTHREKETPNVPLHPEQYAKEMAELQHSPNVAPQVDPSQMNQTPPPAMPGAPGAMPGPDPSQGGPGGQPMQPMSAKLADANTMTPRCPNCGSGSTSIDTDGDPSSISEVKGMCHACHLIFDPANPKPKKQSSLRLVGEIDMPNPNMMQDPHMKWADNAGNDLMEGQAYELHTAGVAVPDMVHVIAVKPDAVELQLVGGVGGQTGHPDFKVARHSQQKYTFVPVQADADTRQNTDPDTMPGVSPEQVPPLDTTDTTPDVAPHTQASVSDSICKCGSTLIDSEMTSPTTTFHQCVACNHGWETKEEEYGREASVDLSWIQESNDLEPSDRHMAMMSAAGGQSRSLSDIASKDERLQLIRARLEANKTAGKNFSPSEKRALIDESGDARNLTDLDLEGTHYTARSDWSGKANGDNVRDDDLFLGM